MPSSVHIVPVALMAGLLLLSSCDSSSSPTAPPPLPRPASIVFNDGNVLSAHRATITSLIQDTVERASAVLAVGSVEFVVLADAGRSIPGWGMGGYTLSGMDIEIVIDPSYSGLEQALQQRLPQVVAHELHHAVRFRGPGPYFTLLEALAMEGLADHFAIELLGVPIPPWSDALSESETDSYLERARPEFDSSFDFNAWFFGIGTDLPRWTGYTLGYRVVDAYLAENPGATAAGLVNTPADVFRP